MGRKSGNTAPRMKTKTHSLLILRGWKLCQNQMEQGNDSEFLSLPEDDLKLSLCSRPRLECKECCQSASQGCQHGNQHSLQLMAELRYSRFRERVKIIADSRYNRYLHTYNQVQKNACLSPTA